MKFTWERPKTLRYKQLGRQSAHPRELLRAQDEEVCVLGDG
jgi:hypothetical protein